MKRYAICKSASTSSYRDRATLVFRRSGVSGSFVELSAVYIQRVCALGAVFSPPPAPWERRTRPSRSSTISARSPWSPALRSLLQLTHAEVGFILFRRFLLKHWVWSGLPPLSVSSISLTLGDKCQQTEVPGPTRTFSRTWHGAKENLKNAKIK